MNKRVIIEYDEQSKAVTAKVNIEYSGDNLPPNEDILKETNELFDSAQRYALNKSILRNR